MVIQDGKENLVQPYMWLGIEDREGSGVWRSRRTRRPIEYSHWDEDEGSEGDNCARMLGNGSKETPRQHNAKQSDRMLFYA